MRSCLGNRVVSESAVEETPYAYARSPYHHQLTAVAEGTLAYSGEGEMQWKDELP